MEPAGVLLDVNSTVDVRVGTDFDVTRRRVDETPDVSGGDPYGAVDIAPPMSMEPMTLEIEVSAARATQHAAHPVRTLTTASTARDPIIALPPYRSARRSAPA
jgi:hypothetical protein